METPRIRDKFNVDLFADFPLRKDFLCINLILGNASKWTIILRFNDKVLFYWSYHIKWSINPSLPSGWLPNKSKKSKKGITIEFRAERSYKYNKIIYLLILFIFCFATIDIIFLGNIYYIYLYYCYIPKLFLIKSFWNKQ